METVIVTRPVAWREPVGAFRGGYVSGVRAPGPPGEAFRHLTLLDQIVDRLAGSAPPARRLWPPDVQAS